MRKRIISLLVFCLLLVLFTGCDNFEKEKHYLSLYDNTKEIETIELKEALDLTIDKYNLSKEGYTFKGWYFEGVKCDSINDFSKDITLFAEWEINKYTYSFLDYDNTIIKEETINYQDKIIAPENPIRESDDDFDYTFISWDKEFDTITNNITIKAVYDKSPIIHNYLTLIDGDKLIDKVEMNNENILSDTKYQLVKDGYTFKGWYNGDTKVSVIDLSIKEDLTLHANWEINKYKYTFLDYDGSIIKDDIISYQEKIIAPENPVRENDDDFEYTFIGWDKEFDLISSDIIINAVYSKKEIDKRTKYVVSYYDGETLYQKLDVYDGDLAQKLIFEKEDKEYYTNTVVEWTTDIDGYDIFDFTTPIKNDITLYAFFDIAELPNKCIVKFFNESGNIIAKQVVVSGEKIKPYTTTKSATAKYTYELETWCTNKALTKVFDENVGVTDHMSLYPRFKRIEKPLSDFDITGKKLAILGDSISTFYKEGSEYNSYYSLNDQFYFPIHSTTIKTVDKTWWYQTIKTLNLNLVMNESLSGSSCCDGNISDRINNLGKKGTPDIIFVFLGTNDNVNGYASRFEKGYDSMLKKIDTKYPDAYVICFTLGYSAYTGYNYTEENRLVINEAIRACASKYHTGLVELDKVRTKETYSQLLGDNLHPYANGMSAYSERAVLDIKSFFKKD